MTVSRRRRNRSPQALAAAALSLFLARPAARGDDSVAYKFENYREEDGRVTVQEQSSSVDQDIGPLTHITLMGTIDAVSGATPTGAPAPPGSDQVVLTQFHERRKAWSGDLTRQIANVSVDVGFADSHESDYVSAGWSVNTLTELNQKNTTVRLGVAGTSDRVEVFFLPEYLPKHTSEAILGVTQLLDPLTFVTVNLTLGNASGYLSEQHKLVQKSIEVFQGIYLQEDFAENRPNERSRETLFASINRAFPKAKGAAEASYRLYTDSFGVSASTFTLSWLQHVGPSVIVSPTLRYFVQGAASFYYYDLDNTPIIPVRAPSGTGPYYSSDFRLSSMDDAAAGIKVTWKPRDWMELDLAYEQYDMHGRDGVTPASAYPRAGITTAGARLLW